MADSRPRMSAASRIDRGWLIVALLATALAAALVLGRLTERLDYIIYDHILSAAERAPPEDIVIVAIDNASLEEIGPWPWPRNVHAALLDRLAEAKPLGVGYDVLFVDPTPDDAILAAAMARNRTFLPLVIDVPGRNGAPYDVLPPAGPLASAAAGIAHDNLHFEGDRVVRQAFLDEGGADRSWIQLGAIMAGQRPDRDIAAGRDGFWQGRPVLIPFGGEAGHIRTISFTDVLNGRIPPQFIAGHHVLVGATAEGLGSSYSTPTSGEISQMSGVEIQAHLLDALLRGDVIFPASQLWVLGIAIAAVWIFLGGLLWLRRGGVAILAFVLIVGVVALSFGLFRFGHIWLPPVSALIALLFVIAVEAWRERVRLRETLMRERISAAAVEGELQAARTIQLGMLPPRADLSAFDPRLDVDALLEPAKSIGGDLYDLIRIDADRIAFLVGDVTGKGVPAALFMALSKALAKSVVLRGVPNLADAASILNEELTRDNSEAMNVTMLIGILNLATGELRLMSAGHEDPLHIRADGEIAIHKLDGGPPFCIVDFPYPDEPMMLAPGETILLISDGVSEAIDGTGGLFGRDRLFAAIRGSGSATAMVEGVRDAVRAFEGGTDPTDDLTVMALRYLG
ncbi:CHASE2 domain-containing protein [Sphingomonas crocodyli]|uniref:CHASE2 domain-containing protein n=1 Tax=Sphingomonas crocodyli TaxID=1979270 RepID=A0A437LUZ9_9SPHN|nr:CHASE2 domain-containing protein [Sphingomonas crocodyli]RVT89219.1 CHASE2 domain-containing protein [Sphingomonas crocodyli]